MKSAALIWVALIASCGELAANPDDDGGPDAGAFDAVVDVHVPCTGVTFSTPTPLAELNTSFNDRDLRLTPDELAAVFASDRNNDGFEPYITNRDSPTSTFAAPVENYPTLVVMNPIVYPSLASDGLSLYFESICNDPYLDDTASLCFSTRTNVDSTFQGETVLYWPGANPYNGPFGDGRTQGDGYVTSDASTYIFAASSGNDGGPENAIYAVYATNNTSNDEAYGDQATLFTPTDPSVRVDNPIISADTLTLFVSTTTISDATPHVQMATRADTKSSFAHLTPLHELDSSGGEYATWISPDMCRIYLTRSVGGQLDLYVASR